jgi:hypothetical protein
MTVVPADQNRRQAVRVNDRILLSSKKLEQNRYNAIDQNYHNGISLYNQKEVGEFAIYLGSQASLARIREKDEDFANFLQHLDAKLSRILTAVSKQPSPIDSLVAQEVSLSGTGLAFFSKQQFSAGDLMELHFVLLPEFLHIYAIAKTISAEKISAADGEFNFRVGCEFVLIMEADRETLIQHLFKRQQLALRNKRIRDKEDLS